MGKEKSLRGVSRQEVEFWKRALIGARLELAFLYQAHRRKALIDLRHGKSFRYGELRFFALGIR